MGEDNPDYLDDENSQSEEDSSYNSDDDSSYISSEDDSKESDNLTATNELSDQFDSERIPLPQKSLGVTVTEEDASASSSNDDSASDSDSCSDSGSDADYTTSDDFTTGTSADESWCSEDEEEYDDLMATMPIALGRKGGPMQLPLKQAPKPIEAPVQEGLVPLMDTTGEMTNPLDGLAMLQSIRSDLEKVGRMIVSNNQGEKFLRRAHILASINLLATNIPSCVLDHLGQEIREGLKAKIEKKDVFSGFSPSATSYSVNVSDHDDSEGSDLSDQCLDYEHDAAGDEMHQYEAGMRETSYDTSDAALSLVSPVRRIPSNSTLSVATPETYRKKPSMSFSMGFKSVITLGGVSEATKTSNAFAANTPTRMLPSTSYFECALLFVDISGFTKLSTKLDPENLSKVINSYFQLIVDTVFEFQGDIQKFAGDALFAEWRVSSTMTLDQCVDAAATCAAALVRDCADFPVMSFGGIVEAAKVHGEPTTTLNIHCGLGVGSMAGIHIGDSKDRREYIYLGDPINQATQACHIASLGQAAASREFLNLLASLGLINNTQFVMTDPSFSIIADREVSHLHQTKFEHQKRNAKSRGVTDHVDGLEVEALIEYRRLMSLYVHPVVVSNDVAAADDFCTSRVNSVAKERHQEEAELRSVYVMFINPRVSTQLTGNVDEDKLVARLLNNIMRLTTRELKKYHGHLRQTILDDKGLVLITTFGLRGSTFPNLVSERALPATVIIQTSLLMELGVESRIGATFGDVYCGPVGGAKRHEYSVMGPSVNLAARLMSLPENSGILVDNAVRRLASGSYAFKALAPVIAKGYKEAVRIFEPLTAIERSWGSIEPNFVGRQQELEKILMIARDMALAHESAPKLSKYFYKRHAKQTWQITHSR
jgi:class 3 adenylate cyclase